MKIKYTNEELEELINYIPEAYALHRHLLVFLKNGYIVANNHKKLQSYSKRKSFTKYYSLEDYTWNRMKNIYFIMFRIPLNELPLLINSNNVTFSAVVKWRLFLGK